jgi:Peptidase MA superfamily
VIRAATRAVHLGRPLLAAIVATALLLPSLAAVTRAADATFGTPTAKATYGQSIDFAVPLTTSVKPDRVELRLLFPGAIGPEIIDVPSTAGTGSSNLSYSLDLTTGNLAPNTKFTATWAAVAAGNVIGLSAPLTVDYQDTSEPWQTITGNLVTVHWYQGSKAFAKQELAIAEKAIADTSALLGVTETQPVDFFIYADDPAFKAATGSAPGELTIGQSRADIRTLFGLITEATMNSQDVRSVVPHELAHLVFDTAVHNPYRFPPTWLNEGLATYLSAGYTTTFRGLVADAVRSGELLPLTALSGEFPRFDPAKAYLAYGTSVSAIDFLVRTYGQDKLVLLVQAYADGLTDDEAFTRALGMNLGAFQDAWLADLGAGTPTKYGPNPAPAGPLPPGWTGPGQTAAPGPGSTPGSAVTTPTAAPTAAPADGGQSAGGTGTGPVLASILGVVALVIIVLAVARRRAGRA